MWDDAQQIMGAYLFGDEVGAARGDRWTIAKLPGMGWFDLVSKHTNEGWRCLATGTVIHRPEARASEA